MRTFKEILKILVNFLNENNIPYMIVGATTLSLHGTPRTTLDIDVIIMLKEENINKFADYLTKNDFFAYPEEIIEALNERSHVTIIDKESAFRIDLKGIYSKFDQESFDRKQKLKIEDLEIWVNSAEDAIISKLSYGSEQDLNDIKGILLRQENLDMSYITQKSKEMKTYPKLIKLLNEIKQRELK